MIKIISAGAGSGKTYRLTQEMVGLLKSGTRASGIIATTFTAKAAAELQERVRTKLLEEGLTQQANDLSNALIGTVHGLGVKLLKRFAFEAGVSPQVDIIADEDQQIFFNQSLAQILTYERVERMNTLCDALGLTKKPGTYDWRRDIRQLVDVARANDFSKTVLESSKKRSFDTFKAYLSEVTEPVPIQSVGLSAEDYNAQLHELLSQTIETLENNGDETKVTKESINDFKKLRNELRTRERLHWHQWVKIAKIKVSAKSKEAVEPLAEYAQTHTQFADFQNDIRDFITLVFDIAIAAIEEYDRFKKQRGLIDYTDMEVHIRHLLTNPSVREVLTEELDLLMVDEFQDTSPIQLDIFLRLSKIARHSIWVGDPKQSIYGFRGAEPRLMQAIIEHVGINDADILKDSWRSRPDIVHATNAIFTKTFQNLAPEQIILHPKRQDGALQTDALVHFHFQLDNGGDKRIRPNQAWFEGCIAEGIKAWLATNPMILPKGEKDYRPAQAGDVAILCRTNDQCQSIAEALHRVGLQVAMSRVGLLETAEAKLVLAVLRYLLNKHDSLSVAEILLLAEQLELSEIIEHRLRFLEDIGEDNYDWRWAHDYNFIKRINDLRRDTVELSANEILNFVLEELDLRRIIATWGNTTQRLDNVDVIRKFSLQYEQACNRLHTAASLGGFLLWLNELSLRGLDTQSSGEGANAVNVLTYHKSKGLEYPVVLLGSLDNGLRDQVFGFSIEPLDAAEMTIDLDNILSGRWLRFWVNPYADQLHSTLLEERINASDVKATAKVNALFEEARLLYVGITRARDYLIFPTYQDGSTKWLNRAWHHGNEEYPTLDTGNETPFEWQGRYLTKDFMEWWFERNHRHTGEATTVPPLSYIEPYSGKQAHSPYFIDTDKENWTGENGIGNTDIFAPALLTKEDADSNQVLRAYLSFLKGDDKSLPDALRLQMAKACADRFFVSDDIDYQQFVKQANAFYNFLFKKISAKSTQKSYPIRTHFKGRLFKSDIDYFIETTEGGYVVIQNADFAGDIKKTKTEAARWATELCLSKRAVAQLTGVSAITSYVHFPFHGVLVELIK